MSFISGLVNKAVGFAGGLLKMVVPSVSDVIGDITKGKNMLDELVQAPSQSIIKEVTGGMWTGEGAEKFLGEVGNTYLPDLQGMTGQIDDLVGKITSAMSAIQEADSKATRLVEDLRADFESIYSG